MRKGWKEREEEHGGRDMQQGRRKKEEELEEDGEMEEVEEAGTWMGVDGYGREEYEKREGWKEEAW